MTAYWVIGGRYADSGFSALEEGAAEERYGPFSTYGEAWSEWRTLSWQAVDECYVRYRIVEQASVA